MPLCARDGSTLEPASVFVHIDIKDYLDFSIKRTLTGVKKNKGGIVRTENLRLTAVPNIGNIYMLVESKVFFRLSDQNSD